MCFPPYISILACHWLLPGKSLYLVWPLPVIHHSSKTRLHGPRLPFLDGALNFIDWPSTFQFLQIFQPLPLQFSRAYLLIQVILFEVSQISSSIVGNAMNISFFFLEHAGELRVISLIGRKKGPNPR